MPSFDIVSEIDWQEIDNAKNQALKEVEQRFDFKSIKCTIDVDQKKKEITLTASDAAKLDAFVEVVRTKLAKRGFSLLSFDFQKPEPASMGSARQRVIVQAGIDTDKAKILVKAVKEQKLKVDTQIQDEQVRVIGKKRDDLQTIMALLKEKQNELKLPLQFKNFRD